MLSVRISEELDTKVELLAEQENTTKSDIVIRALELYLQEKKQKARPFQLAQGLFGNYGSGEGDLSRKYKQKVRKKINEKTSN